MALKHILGNLPVIKILDFLIDNQGHDFTKKEIAEEAEIGPTAMKNNFPNLVECGVVFEARRVGGVGLYSLDVTNEMTQSLIEFDVRLTEYCDKRSDEALDEVFGDPLPEPPED